MITVVSVNYHSTDFASLMIDSVRRHSKEEYPILILDNSGDLPEDIGATVTKAGGNCGHGPGLDRIVPQVKTQYTLVLDIDSHVLRAGWEDEFLAILTSDEKVKLISAEGIPTKVFCPFVQFFETEYFTKGGFTFREKGMRDCSDLGYGQLYLDVGVDFGLETMRRGNKVHVLKSGDTYYASQWHSEHGKNRNVFNLNGVPSFYHHWYGSRFYRERRDVVDDKTKDGWLESKRLLFDEYTKRYPDAQLRLEQS